MNQHRVPQVYLKQWGYKAGDKRWYIFTINRENKQVKESRIDSFSTAINVFDYLSDDLDDKRHYETTAGIIESHYRTVVRSIEHQKRLNTLHEDVLRHFIASLICRSEAFRDFFTDMLADNEQIEGILEEITMFEEQDMPPLLGFALKIAEGVERLSLVQGLVTNHISKLLRSFKAVIIRDFGDLNWFTSDNPVHIDFQDNYELIITWDSEIYLPLSPKLCLFLFNETSEKNDNPLRRLPPNRIHDSDFETFQAINTKLIQNGLNDLIIPLKHKDSFIGFSAEQLS
jgi:Protein of unknown function (DUF4238)